MSRLFFCNAPRFRNPLRSRSCVRAGFPISTAGPGSRCRAGSTSWTGSAQPGQVDLAPVFISTIDLQMLRECRLATTNMDFHISFLFQFSYLSSFLIVQKMGDQLVHLHCNSTAFGLLGRQVQHPNNFQSHTFFRFHRTG